MAIIEVYTKNISSIKSETDLLNYLTIGKNIVSSNRDKDFFVNWNNANNYIKKYSEEIALLNSILDYDDKLGRLEELLNKYKGINKLNEIIPILIAVSDKKIDFQLGNNELDTRIYDFSTTEECIEFLKLSGFSSFLKCFHSLRDYIFGVKVGMDTNGRKNRSGTFNEDIIKDILNKKLNTTGLEIFYQKSFGKILDKNTLGKLPAGYSTKRFDVLIKKGEKYINLEINHFGGGGSKQEIADSYRTRNNDFKKANIGFIWNTDGSGWYKKNSDENKLLKSISDIDFVTNIKMLKNTNIFNDIVNYYFK